MKEKMGRESSPNKEELLQFWDFTWKASKASKGTYRVRNETRKQQHNQGNLCHAYVLNNLIDIESCYQMASMLNTFVLFNTINNT